MKLKTFKSYDDYKRIQTKANYKKLKKVWVSDITLLAIADYVNKKIPSARFGLCHGVRNGYEVNVLRKLLGFEVLGTDISDTATQFPHVEQWDFHQIKEQWVGAVDFIYSNSWDHSYDPDLMLTNWMRCLNASGRCFLEWTRDHGDRGVSGADCFGLSLYELQQWVSTRFDIENIVELHPTGNPRLEVLRTSVKKRRRGRLKGTTFIIVIKKTTKSRSADPRNNASSATSVVTPRYLSRFVRTSSGASSMTTHETLLHLQGSLSGKRMKRFDYLGHCAHALHLEVKLIVEVGVYRGSGAAGLRRNFPNAWIYLVDPWVIYDDYCKRGVYRSKSMEKQIKKCEVAYARVRKRFKDDSKIKIIRSTSVDAARHFSGQADIVFIDGNHEYSYVRDDIMAWLPLVREGGLLCGHDYKARKDVRRAVNEILSPIVVSGLNKGDAWVHLKDDSGV